MTSPAAIQADYCDLRFIKSRKVCQIVVEIPIEAGGAFVAAFGTPDPSKGVPIALARINPAANSSRRSEAKAEPKRKGGPLCRRAAILCNEPAFWTFLNERYDRLGFHYIKVETDDHAAVALRALCGVESRRDLDHDAEPRDKFLKLDSEYTAWRVIA